MLGLVSRLVSFVREWTVGAERTHSMWVQYGTEISRGISRIWLLGREVATRLVSRGLFPSLVLLQSPDRTLFSASETGRCCVSRTYSARHFARVLPPGRYRPERHVRFSQRRRGATSEFAHRNAPHPRLGSATSSRSLRFSEGESLSRGMGSIEESSNAGCLGNHR